MANTGRPGNRANFKGIEHPHMASDQSHGYLPPSERRADAGSRFAAPRSRFALARNHVGGLTPMLRAEALDALYPDPERHIVVTTMGSAAAELSTLGHRHNFSYLVHAIGHCSAMGLI